MLKLYYQVDIGTMLRAERKRCGVTLKDVSDAMTVCDTNISGFELGNRHWDLDKTLEYARYLGIEQRVKDEIILQVVPKVRGMVQ